MVYVPGLSPWRPVNQNQEVSRPLLRLLLGDIGFVYPVMSTYDGNRSFASYTKTKTVESAV
jgi:hypothetical protein